MSGQLGISLMGTLAIVEVRSKLAFLYHLLENHPCLQSPFGLPGRSNMEKGEAHKRQSRVNFFLPLFLKPLISADSGEEGTAHGRGECPLFTGEDLRPA